MKSNREDLREGRFPRTEQITFKRHADESDHGCAFLRLFSRVLLALLFPALFGSTSAPAAFGAEHTIPSPDADVVESRPESESGVPLLNVWFLDVKEGAATVVKLPDGKCLLVDGGPPEKDVVVPFLEETACTTLAAVVLTHPHDDHVGGLTRVIKEISVERVYDPAVMHPTKSYERFLEAIEADTRIAYGSPEPEEVWSWDTTVEIQVLNSGFPPGSKELNDASIVLRIRFDSATVMLTGDAEEKAERAVIRRFSGRLHSDLLQVAHHGSRSSTRKQFLNEVSPRFAVISCGRGNPYGHPHAEVLRRLREAGVKVFRTDEDGTIHAWTNGRDWFFEKERLRSVSVR